MNRHRPLIAVCFCAGLFGALINSLFAWQLGALGLTAWAGVKLTPALTLGWLYPRLVWGGLWGLVFFMAVAPTPARRHWMRKGLWISLLPTAAQLFWVFPAHTAHGMAGLGLGSLTPLFVLLINAVWGAATGLFARTLWGR